MEAGYPVFGPTAMASRLEGSKSFAKDLMMEIGVPTADYKVFTDIKLASDHIMSLPLPIVIKASGLAAGKGVLICETYDMAISAAEGMLTRDAFGSAGREIVIEEYLSGKEMSLLAFVDGKDYLLLPPSRDHKRAYNDDKGPNTGGMGAYSPVTDLSMSEIVKISESIFPPIIEHMSKIGTPYSGCLYAGLMIAQNEVKVLEFNCRFGDPETQVLLPLLSEDLLEIMISVSNGTLGQFISDKNIKADNWQGICKNKHAVTVVAAADGYPGSYKKDIPIESIPEDSEKVVAFHAGTKATDSGLVTSGGRVLSMTGLGATFDEAKNNAYNAVSSVKFEGVRFRSDIGNKAK